MGRNGRGKKPESRWTMDQDTAVAVLVEQVASLKSRLEALEKDAQSKFDKIELKLDEALKTSAGRPSWTMTILLSGLMTVSTGLVVFVFTN